MRIRMRNLAVKKREKIIMNTKNRESRRESIQKEWMKFFKTYNHVKFMDMDPWDIKAHEAEMGLVYLTKDDLLKEALDDVVEDNDNLFSVKEVDLLDFGALPPIDKSDIKVFDDVVLIKHEKDDAGAKQKKKPRVFVEEESISALRELVKDDAGLQEYLLRSNLWPGGFEKTCERTPTIYGGSWNRIC